MSQALAVVFGAVALGLLAFGAISLVRANRGIEQRLERFAGPEQDRLKTIEKEASKRASPLGDSLNRALAGRNFANNLATQLARADAKLTVGEFLALQAITIIAGGVVGWLLSGASIVFALLTAVFGFFVPRFYLNLAKGRRLRAFNYQLGDFLNLMVNGLRAGYSVTQAMEAVASELPPPLSTEVGRLVQEMQIGLTMEQALANMLRRVTSDDLDLIVTAMNVQREVGGNLAEILDVISFTIRERVRIKGEISALTAQGRATAWVISLLPVVLVLLLFLLNRPYIMQFFNPETRNCGVPLISLAAIMVLSGFWAVQKIVAIDI